MDKQHKEQYTLIKQIGGGAQGEVYLIQSRSTSQKYALKKMKLSTKDPQLLETYKTEIKALNRINNVHVIRIKETFISNKPYPCLNIITEYVDGCDLSQEIQKQKESKKPFTEVQIKDWIIHIALGLDAIHSERVIHRDIKPSNIFLTKDKIAKVGDFGISKCLNFTFEKALTMNLGTPLYIAPEMCTDDENGKGYTSKVDMWSFGVLLYEMIMFETPFKANSIPAVILKIIDGKYKEIPKNVSRDLRHLVYKLLKTNPNERYSAKDILKLDFIQQRINYLTTKKNLNEEVILPRFHSKELKPTPSFIKRGSIKLHSNSGVKSNRGSIQPNTNNDENNNVPQILRTNTMPKDKNTNAKNTFTIETKDTFNSGSTNQDNNDATTSTLFGNTSSDNKADSQSDMQRSLLLMSQINLNDDNKESTVKSTKSDNTLRYKGLSPTTSNDNDDNICNVDCGLNDPESKVKGFNETCKGLSLSMNNNMDPNETRAFVSLRESLVKSIGEDGFKRLCNLSVLCDNNKKEKFKNEMKTKFIQEHKTKTEITNELKKIDQFYSYGEPL